MRRTLKFKWKHPDERYTCHSADEDYFYGAYWKKLDGGWYAHICPLDVTWYSREFSERVDEKKIRKECEKLINNFREENEKWEID